MRLQYSGSLVAEQNSKKYQYRMWSESSDSWLKVSLSLRRDSLMVTTLWVVLLKSTSSLEPLFDNFMKTVMTSGETDTVVDQYVYC